MPELSANSPVNWNFTAETNAQGRTYIKAYKMCWDKVAKKPQTCHAPSCRSSHAR